MEPGEIRVGSEEIDGPIHWLHHCTLYTDSDLLTGPAARLEINEARTSMNTAVNPGVVPESVLDAYLKERHTQP